MAWVAAIPAIVSVIKSLSDSASGNNGQGQVQAAGANKLHNMDEATRVLQHQRGQRAQTQMNMLANRMGAYQGANNVLASMYGPQGSMAPNLNVGGGPGGGRPPGAPAPPSGPPGGMQNPTSARTLFGGSGLAPPSPGQAPPSGPPGGMQSPASAQRLSAGGLAQPHPPPLSPAIASIAQMMGGGAPSGRPPTRRAV